MKKFKKSGLIFAATFICVIFLNLCNLCFSQEIPQKISYQGKLLESGIPVTGTKSITFTIDTWSENHPSVQVTDGLYSVTLGETTPIPTSIFDNSSSVNLQINVAGTDLLPQTEILSVPYTYKAEKAVDAEKIAGNTVSTTSPSTDEVLKWNGASWSPQADNGLTLPYTGVYSGNSPAFQITNNGINDAFKIINNGPFGALQIYNSASSDWGVYISNESDESAFNISNSGTGRTLTATTSSSVYDGNPCAYFHILEPTNDGTVLYAATNGSGYAGKFYGDVDIVGNISKSSGTFKIDHPLDPANKYLYHSFVESPDMMNVYNGNIVLDNSGEATVELPEWFEVLNKEFRYQLTCIGGYAPVYIAEKISNNSFKISGGTSGMEVSWQITGIRQDPYANDNRIQVEVDKPDKEKGHYLHYKEYNQPIEKSIRAVKHPEILEKLENK